MGGINILYIDIASDIQEKIENGILKEGEKLGSERHIAEQYGVSRNVIRESLKTLSLQGWLKTIPCKGTYVSRPDAENLSNGFKAMLSGSQEDLLQMLEVRELLEAAVIERVVKEASEQDVCKLQELYDKMNMVIEIPEEYVKLDEEFHNYLYHIVKNTIMVTLINSFGTIIQEKLFTVRLAYPERIKVAQKDHYNIITGIRTDNLELAKSAMQTHMDGLRHEIENLQL